MTVEVVESSSLETFKTQQGTEQHVPTLSCGLILGKELDQMISIGSLKSRLCCSSREKAWTHTCPHMDTYESHYHRIPQTHTKPCQIIISWFYLRYVHLILEIMSVV